MTDNNMNDDLYHEYLDALTADVNLGADFAGNPGGVATRTIERAEALASMGDLNEALDLIEAALKALRPQVHSDDLGAVVQATKARERLFVILDELTPVKNHCPISRWSAGDRMWHESAFVPTAELCLDETGGDFEDDDGNVVLFESDMDGDWWEAQFSVDANLCTRHYDELGRPAGVEWHPNWTHIKWQASKRDGARDFLLEKVAKATEIDELEATSRKAAKYAAWATMVNRGDQRDVRGRKILKPFTGEEKSFSSSLRDAYGNEILNQGLDYRRYAIVVNEAFKKGCELKGFSKALIASHALNYFDDEQQATSREVAKKLTTWGRQKLGNGFRVLPLRLYSNEKPEDGEDIFDHGARRGEFEIDGAMWQAVDVTEEEIRDMRYDAPLPLNRTFRLTDDEIEEWLGKPAMPSLSASISELTFGPTLSYTPPTPREMGF